MNKTSAAIYVTALEPPDAESDPRRAVDRGSTHGPALTAKDHAMHQLPVRAIPLDKLEDEGNGLVRFRQNLGDLTALKMAITAYGLLSPPTVWTFKVHGHERHVVLDGNRRVAAIKELAKKWNPERGEFPLASVTCVIFDGRTEDARQASIQLHCHSPQMDTNVGDTLAASEWLLSYGYNQTEAGSLLNVTQGRVSQMQGLRAALCDEAFAQLRMGGISAAEAKSLSKLLVGAKPDVPRQREVLEQILKKARSDEQTE